MFFEKRFLICISNTNEKPGRGSNVVTPNQTKGTFYVDGITPNS